MEQKNWYEEHQEKMLQQQHEDAERFWGAYFAHVKKYMIDKEPYLDNEAGLPYNKNYKIKTSSPRKWYDIFKIWKPKR